MDATIFSSLRVLLQLIGVIVVVACLVILSRFFIDVAEDHPAIKTQIIPIPVFGILSIFGTISGVKIPSALVNVRELGLMVIRVK